MKSFEDLLSFVQKKHAGQERACGVPTWQHLFRVSMLLKQTLEYFKEGTPRERIIISYSALGHDILEDTDVSHDEVRDMFGTRGYELILGMTNEDGDGDVSGYVKRMAKAEEAVRLIKYADLYDNLTNVVYALKCLKVAWAHDYFLPIVTPMRKKLQKTHFSRFKNTANTIRFMVNSSANMLDKKLDIIPRKSS